MSISETRKTTISAKKGASAKLILSFLQNSLYLGIAIGILVAVVARNWQAATFFAVMLVNQTLAEKS